MSNAASDYLLVPSPEQNLPKSQLLNGKIDEIVQAYNQVGSPAKKLHKDLRNRFKLTWVSPTTKGASTSTQSRNRKAQNVYLQVLNACPHFYIAFISVISPTVCSQPYFENTVTELLDLNKENPVQLKLNLEAKEFFKSIAVAGTFAEDPRYVKFICSLFPEDHSQPSEYRSSNTGQTSPKTSQQSIAQYTDSFGTERSVAVRSPASWVQQDSTVPTAQPDGLQHSPETRSQHSHVMIRKNSTPQSQPSTAANYQVADERPSKRLRLGSKESDLELPGEGRYYSFSCMRRHMVENLPEPYRAGMKASNLWCKERDSGGLAITSALRIYLPETPNEDALLTLRLGYSQGFNIFDLFGLGDLPEEAAVEDARD